MADNCWLHHQLRKRPRNDYDLTPGAPGLEGLNYLPRNDCRAGHYQLKDSTSIGASYDRYLQNQKSSYGSGKAANLSGSGLTKSVGGGMSDDNSCSVPFRDPVMNQVKMGYPDPGACTLKVIPDIRPVVPGLGLLLPLDASDTIYVEGLPRDCTEREVAHIFRPFLGYKETRLVTKEPQNLDEDQKVLCFVDFTNATSAMTAMYALQGYKMDERKLDSPLLKLKFSHCSSLKPGH